MMDLGKAAIQFLNPGQLPVLAMDQPLYVLAKGIQWIWTSLYKETKFIIMMGGFDDDQAALKTLGDFLANSGLVSAIAAERVASSGVADTFLRVSHVTRTRHAHQVTYASLYILLCRGYHQFCAHNPGQQLSLDAWISQMKDTHMYIYAVAYQSRHVSGNMIKKDSEPMAIKILGWKQYAPTLPPYPLFITISTISKK